MNRRAAYAAGVGYASIFGFSFLITKEALATLGAFELLALRFAVAAVIMTILLGLGLISVNYRGKPTRDLLVVCLLQPLLYFSCETLGVRESASSTAGLVLGALPATVAILGAVVLKETLSGRQSAFLAMAVAGVAVIVLFGGAVNGQAGSLRGLLFLLGAVASATFFNVLARRSSRSFSPVEMTYAMMWVGALCFGVVALVLGLADGGLAGPGGVLGRARSAWAGVLYLSLLSSVLGFFLVNLTLARLKASQSAVFANLTTVVAVAAGVFIRGEGFGIVQLLGSAMIVLGVWGTNADSRREMPGVA